MSILQSRLFFRVTIKSREVYLLKILSLAVAFACSTLIALFALHEFGYDRFHRDPEKVFRILQKNNHENHIGNRLSDKIPSTIFSSLRSNVTRIATISRLKHLNGIALVSGAQTFRQNIHAVDTSIADIFSFDIVEGSWEAFKGQSNRAIVSASAANRYFGNMRAAGKMISIHSSTDTLVYTVAAVFRDFPENGHESFEVFISFDSASLQRLHFNPLRSAVYGRFISDHSLASDLFQATLSSTGEMSYHIQPLPEIYFGPRAAGENASHGDQYSITILISITVLIVFLALTTFINLTTLTLPHRTKEIAVKKLAGISQPRLVFAFVLESLSIVATSSMLGFLVLSLTSRIFENILSINFLSLLSAVDPALIAIWAGFFLVFTISPVFMVLRYTRATPSQLLSTETISFPQLKKMIMFLQLGISIFLIVASMVIRRQINYSLLKEPGRNHDQVVYLSYPNGLTDQGLRSLRKGWKEYHPNIIDVMGTTQLPNKINSKELTSPFYVMSVDPAFNDFFKLNMISGNWFRPNDGDSICVVNEIGSKLLGDNNANVTGVVEDMAETFNQGEKPVKISIAPYYHFNYPCIRILEVDIRRTVGYLSNYFGNENHKPTISYLDKNFERWLKYQDGLNSLSGMLAVISGLLSCCAIYGLSISIVRDKIKQIAVHKLFGATTFRITRLLVKSFTRQVLIAMIVFGPLSYLILKELLRTFVYSTSFQLSDLLVPILYCAIVILLLCGFQARSLNRQNLTSALKQ